MELEHKCNELAATLCEIVNGAKMLLAVSSRDDAFNRYCKEVVRVAEAGLSRFVLNVNTEPVKPRWKCPHCQSLNVQISFPTWYTETIGVHNDRIGELKFVETDAEADISWWSCDDCGESDSGEPDAND